MQHDMQPFNVSDICGQLIRDLQSESTESLTVQDILQTLEDRAYALIILLLALPNAVPAPFIPGISSITGLPALIFSCEAALGRPHPRLPRFAARFRLNRRKVIRHLERVRPFTLKIEALMRPRLSWIVARRHIEFGFCALISFFLILPIPFGNIVAAWALGILSFAIARRDGLFVLIGITMGLAALAWNLLVIVLGVEIVQYLTARA